MKYHLLALFLFTSHLGNAQNQGDVLFGAAMVHDVQIYLSQPNYWDSLTYYYAQIAITGNKTYMRADSVIIDGTVLPNVGVRLKGNSAYGWAANFPSVKLPFKLDFNKYISGQNYDGLKKLNLHNEDRDPSMMRSKIISDFLQEQGVYASRVSYTRNSINGVYWGLYTMVEQIDKTFLSNRFGMNGGNLYKALPKFTGWEAAGGATLEYLGNQAVDYDSIYVLKTNETVNDWSGFVNLLYQINNTTASEFKDSLEAVMNTDSYLKAWAAMRLFVNGDAYPFLGNNYFVYANPLDNKFQWIAWDFNLGIGSARSGMTIPQAESSSVLFLTPGGGTRPLGTRMLDDPDYYDRYLAWVCQFAQTAFDTTLLSPKIDSIANMIRVDLYADTNKFYGNLIFEESLVFEVLGFPGLKPFIANRRLAVLNELQSLGCPTITTVPPQSQSTTVMVYPNPFSTFLTVDLPKHQDPWTWQLYNSKGQLVQQLDNITELTLTIPREHLPTGIYFYKINLKEGLVISGKQIIE